MPARAIMIMGTGSDVGKSLIVAGLCRHFANAGFRVAPFKPQNMSNNAAVTEDGGEIGRAQALQARAARCAVTVDLNPVLLKPQSETGAQIVVQGKVVGSARAREFQDRKRALMPAVLESFAPQSRVRSNHCGGGGERLRDQPSEERHCQYGFCRSGGCACDPCW
jgi:adenosylcobyric acid synthase